MSLFWMEDLYELIRWRVRNGIGKNYKLIIGGNHAMCYPNSVIAFVDAAFCGDGGFGTANQKITLLWQTGVQRQ